MKRKEPVRTAMDNARAGFVVLLLRAPQVLEGTERSQDGSTNPYWVFSLRRGDNLDLVIVQDGGNKLDEFRCGIFTNLHTGRRQWSKLFLHAIGNTREHSCATGKDNIAVQITTDIEITFKDGVIPKWMDEDKVASWLGRRNSRSLVDASRFKPKERRLEQSFRRSEAAIEHVRIRGRRRDE